MAEAVEGLLLSCEGLLTQSRVDKAPSAADCTAQVRAACRVAGDVTASLLTAAACLSACVRALSAGELAVAGGKVGAQLGNAPANSEQVALVHTIACRPPPCNACAPSSVSASQLGMQAVRTGHWSGIAR